MASEKGESAATDADDKREASVEPSKPSGKIENEAPKSWWAIARCLFFFVFSLWVFLLGLQLLGDAFKCLGGKGAGKLFAAIKNPIAGLMTGILATVMVQSSSTSTSIVVGLVGADQITVNAAIPIIMGANIGTSVTNTIVSMGQSANRVDLERAFAGATVHDMFNYLSVAVLLPVELICAAIQGQGGPLFWITQAVTDAIMGAHQGSDEMFDSPIKAITGPVAKVVIKNNKYIINALSLGEPAAKAAVMTNSSVCRTTRRLAAFPELVDGQPEQQEEIAGVGAAARALSSSDIRDCSQYYCVGKQMDKDFEKVSKSAYKAELEHCAGYVLDAQPCTEHEHCYLNAGEYYTNHVAHARIIKSGFTRGAGDVAGGVISLVIALVLLIGGLFFLCKCLHVLMMGKAKKAIARATRLNNYVAMLVGVGVTILVQSSSVVTSALTPFCGIGVLPLEKMLPLTLGANIGTTVTALIASLATFTENAVHIALCHLFFNIFGILIWFPVPVMRQIPLSAARLLGLYASYYRLVPIIYITLAFVFVPGLALGISALLGHSLAAGAVVLVLTLAALGCFLFWWVWLGGCYRVLSKADREKGREELQRANEQVRGQEGERQQPGV